MKRLLRLLFVLLGAGIGAAAALTVVRVMKVANPMMTMEVGGVVAGYAIAIGLGMLVFFAMSKRALALLTDVMAAVEQRLTRMTTGQVASYTLGLICGLIIAALLAQILHFLGDSMFTATMAVLLYVVLGTAGLAMGHLREKDMTQLLSRMHGMTGRRFMRSPHQRLLRPRAAAKIADTSVLIDGRLLEVYKTGFLEGELLIPDCVLAELQAIADAADPAKRIRGQRGLDMLKKLQSAGCSIRVEAMQPEGETDTQLLQLARKTGMPILTGDQSLMRAAQISGIQTLNLNALANALRPAVHAGDELLLALTKEGKELTQGVGYLDDGTMVVVEGGRQHLGRSVTVIVTSALQTNAGRMVFGKVKE